MRNLILAVVVGLAVGCSDSTSPTTPSEVTPSFQVVDRAQHEQLKQQLEAAKQRMKQERDEGKLALEVARAEWKTYRKQFKDAKKTGGVVIDLLRCEPRPLEGDAEIIGPQGGTLHIGEHELVIPRGALSEEKLIVAESRTSSLVDVQFEPEGLQFQVPATLTLSYKGCDVPADVDLMVAYLSVGNQIAELPPSKDYRSYSEVIGAIRHFSRYAVAY
jgi:hypothetical protein